MALYLAFYFYFYYYLAIGIEVHLLAIQDERIESRPTSMAGSWNCGHCGSAFTCPDHGPAAAATHCRRRNLDGFAKDFAFSEKPSANFPTSNLTFAGLMSLMDPPREGVPEAVLR